MSALAPDQDPSTAGEAPSSLGVARARRRLTVEQVAERAGLSPEAVEALEQSRLYRFPSLNEAVAAAVLYTSALGISSREARRLAGLPVRDALLASFSPARIGASIAFVAAIALLAWFVIMPRLGGETSAEPAATDVLLPAPELTPSLPERADIQVDVLNGSTAGRAAIRLADRVAGLAYSIGEVANAPRSDYPETRVYFTPGSLGIAERLAGELGVNVQELPGGDEPQRLIVIVGAQAPLE